MGETDFDNTVIRANQMIMIRLPSENFRLVKLQPGQTIKLGKFGQFNVDDVIGKPFGHTYEIGENSELRAVQDVYEMDDNEERVNELLPHENNRQLTDDPTVQNLDMKGIEELKKQGMTGQEIIDSLKSSHADFTKKTQFSQQKYIKRKQQKFLQRFTPVPIGSSELIDIYLDKEPQRIANISEETLGMMMSMANVRPGGKYLVVDEINGVLTSALMERLGGEGLIVVAHENEHPNLDALKYMNYSEETLKMIKRINWLDYFHPEEAEEFEEKDEAELEELKTSKRGAYFKKRVKHQDYTMIRDLIDNHKFDGLLTATQLEMPSLVPRLVDALNGSAAFVTYSEYKENQVDLFHSLHKDSRIVAPTIMETKCRKYQTLPGRMHPHMTTRGFGGYILFGSRVFPCENLEQVGVKAHSNKKRKVQPECE